jgi:hypothetical protein
MNSTEHFSRCANRQNRWIRWFLLVGLLAAVLARTAMAGDFAGNTYTNNGIVAYPARRIIRR